MASHHQTEKIDLIESPTLYVVEDDSGLYEQYKRLAERLALRLSLHASGKDLLALENYKRPCCLILELVVDNESGEDLQIELTQRRATFPIVVNTRFVIVKSAVRVMECGAMTVLQKPSTAEQLEQHVRAGIALDEKQLEFDRMHRQVESILETLSQRQRQILEHVVEGIPTKAIARKLGVSNRLVENERSEILKTFGASSTPDVTLRIGQYRILDAIRVRIDSEHTGPFRPNPWRGGDCGPK